MNKLKIVRDHIRSNPRCKIIIEKNDTYFPGVSSKDFLQFEEIYVAPSDKGLYTAEELNDFMSKELIPKGVEPSAIDYFSEDEKNLSFGKLYFDDVIGHIVSSYVITDVYAKEHIKRIKNESIIKDNEIFITVVDAPLKRRTLVKLYPNEKIAMDAFLNNINEYGISKKMLENYI